MEILIDYISETREAFLKTDEETKIWTSIVRACQDVSDNSLIVRDKSITLPWWSFLLVREAVGYHLSKGQTKISYSPSARKLLLQAKDRQQLYNKGTTATKLSEIEVKQKLLDEGFVRTLTNEQLQNVRKLGVLPSCATFSVPGAGKTTEALAYFCCTKTENTKLLIVCPKNAFAVWEEQIQTIFPDKEFRAKRLTGGLLNIQLSLEQKLDVGLITYQQLPFVSEIISRFLHDNDVFVFLDESHKMKRGDSGKIGGTLLGLSHLPIAKCIMSGTPMPNDIGDLVPQFKFLYPEISVSAENVKELISPIYVRTTKSQLNIPPVTRVQTQIDLSPSQRMFYQLLCSEYAREASGLQIADKKKLRKLGKSALTLIQLVSNPSLLASRVLIEHKDLLKSVLSEGDSPKLEYITNRARQLARQGKKTIIWSSFVANVELISARLYDLGADFIHGKVEAGSDEEENTRERKIKRFHDDDNAFVLVANPAACSEGISLHTVCHHAIYLDRNYNAAQYLQSEDRIHRLGLGEKQQTIVEILYSPNTIDESVANRLAKKVQLMGDVLDDPDLRVDPIPYDPDNDSEFSFEDANDFLNHINSEMIRV